MLLGLKTLTDVMSWEAERETVKKEWEPAGMASEQVSHLLSMTLVAAA